MSERAQFPCLLPDDNILSAEAPPPLESMEALRRSAEEALECSGRKFAALNTVIAFWAATDTPQHRDLLCHIAKNGCGHAAQLAIRYWHGLSDKARTAARSDQAAAFLRLGAIERGARESDQLVLDDCVRARASSALVVSADAERNRFQYPLL